MAQAKSLADLQKNDVSKMTRDEYIKSAEKIEFKSVQDGSERLERRCERFRGEPNDDAILRRCE